MGRWVVRFMVLVRFHYFKEFHVRTARHILVVQRQQQLPVVLGFAVLCSDLTLNYYRCVRLSVVVFWATWICQFDCSFGAFEHFLHISLLINSFLVCWYGHCSQNSGLYHEISVVGVYTDSSAHYTEKNDLSDFYDSTVCAVPNLRNLRMQNNVIHCDIFNFFFFFV